MAYRVGKVRYRNFGPFEDETFDFALPGLTGIQGHMAWKPGSNDNGSGKSMLFDGVFWGLCDRCLRADYRGDDVVRIGSKGGCSVEVNIIGGATPIRVVRYRKHTTKKNRVYLFVDDEDVTRGTNAETQAAIEHLLGADFSTLSNSIAFGAREDVRSFMSATDSDRKKTFDRLLGLEVLTRAEQVARKRLATHATALQADVIKTTRLETRLEEIRARIAQVGTLSDVGVLELEADETQLAKVLARRWLAEWIEKLAKAEEEVKGEEVAAKVAWVAYEAERKEADRLRAKYTQEASAASKTLAVEASKRDHAERRLKAIQKLIDDGDCPTCGQVVTDALSSDEVAELKAKSKAAAIAAKAAGDAQIAAHEGQLSVQNPTAPTFPSLESAKKAAREVENRWADAKQRLAAATVRSDAAKQRLDDAQHLLKKLQADRAEVESAFEEHQDATLDRRAEADRLEFWVEAFSNRGLKSFMIEAATPAINQAATMYAQRLLGSGAYVRIQATTQLKSSEAVRERLSVEAKIPGCCNDYAGASKGQKRRLDLALLLAFRDVVAARANSPFSQFIADELFDGVDKAGAESVIELLREISKDCPVTLVTHSAFLQSAVDRVFTVRHLKPYCATLANEPARAQGAKKVRKKVASKPGT